MDGRALPDSQARTPWRPSPLLAGLAWLAHTLRLPHNVALEETGAGYEGFQVAQQALATGQPLHHSSRSGLRGRLLPAVARACL